MYQKDYILRLIEMIRDLIMGILGLIKKGQLEQAEQQLENLYYDFLKEDSAFFNTIPAEVITTKLLREHNYTHGHLEILALLFDAEAELQEARGKKDLSTDFSKKALMIFEFLENEQKTYSLGRAEKIRGLREKIKKLSETNF
ncbi:MAG: hypothetical protein MUE74_04480 [Bacteroidales bacterium]|jgi:hypothetical protein|nr:hypothetical protein [Bacteroidales bacterium]